MKTPAGARGPARGGAGGRGGLVVVVGGDQRSGPGPASGVPRVKCADRGSPDSPPLCPDFQAHRAARESFQFDEAGAFQGLSSLESFGGPPRADVQGRGRLAPSWTR